MIPDDTLHWEIPVTGEHSTEKCMYIGSNHSHSSVRIGHHTAHAV